MKTILNCIVLSSCILLAAGCVRRTVTVAPGTTQRSSSSGRKITNSQEKVIEEKTIWFWQDGFRNPGK